MRTHGGVPKLWAACFVAVLGCASEEMSGSQSAPLVAEVHTPIVAEELLLHDLAREEAARHTASLSLEERRVEEDSAAALGVSPGRLELAWHPDGTIAALRGFAVRLPAGTSAPEPEDRARSFIDEHAVLFGLAGSRTLSVSRVLGADTGTVVEFLQRLHGLPVFGSQLRVRVGNDGTIEGVNARVISDATDPPGEPAVSAAEAAALRGGRAESAELGFVDRRWLGGSPSSTESASFIWRIFAEERDAFIFVSALTGEEVGAQRLAHDDAHREIFQCNGCEGAATLPGALQHDTECHTGGSAACPMSCTTDCQVAPPWPGTSLQADQNTEIAENYWTARPIPRDGWDDGDCSVPGSCDAPFGVSFHRMRTVADVGNPATPAACGASWSPHYHPTDSAAATVSLGVASTCVERVQHEFAHGVNEIGPDIHDPGDCGSAGLQGEGFSDVFGEFTHLWQNGSADWVHGTGCPPCTGERRSNLAEPGCYTYLCASNDSCGQPGAAFLWAPQPDNWANYRNGCAGHFNSTIASTVARLMARSPGAGSTTHWGVASTGIGATAAENVWYETIQDPMLDGTMASLRFSMMTHCLSVGGAGCTNAVESAGIWEGATTPTPSWSPRPRAVSFSRFTVGVQDRRYLFYERLVDGVTPFQCYRYTTCPVRQGCSWSAENCISQGTADLGPTSAVIPGAEMFACFVRLGAIRCERQTSAGAWVSGPHPSTSNIVHEPSITYDSGTGRLYMAYRRSSPSTVYWRRLEGSPGSWFWGAQQNAGFGSPEAPVLASGGGHMFIVYARESDRRIAYRRFVSGAWGPEWLAGQSDEVWPPVAYSRPVASVFKGALQIAVNGRASWYPNAERDVFMFSALAPCETTASAPACSQPENAQQWTRFVRQEGQMYTAHLGTDDWGYLQLWHRVPGSDVIRFRSRFSR